MSVNFQIINFPLKKLNAKKNYLPYAMIVTENTLKPK